MFDPHARKVLEFEKQAKRLSEHLGITEDIKPYLDRFNKESGDVDVFKTTTKH